MPGASQNSGREFGKDIVLVDDKDMGHGGSSGCWGCFYASARLPCPQARPADKSLAQPNTTIAARTTSAASTRVESMNTAQRSITLLIVACTSECTIRKPR